MNISTKKVVTTMILGLMAAPLSVTLASPVLMVGISDISSLSNEMVNKLGPDMYVFDRKMADVIGDDQEDAVYLIGHKKSKESNYADHFTLVVEDGATKEEITIDLDKFGGYEGKLFLGDFTGANKADVMVSAPTGGSGGILGCRIISFASGHPAVIFNEENNRGISFTGKFVDGFQARIQSDEYGINTFIDLQAKKELYTKSKIYSLDGTVLKEVNPISYPLGSLEPVDVDRDGIYELKGIQRIIGAYGADGIGHVYSNWKYENQKWVAQNIEITSFLRNFQGSSSIAKPSTKTILLTELDHHKEITLESGDMIQIKLKEISGTGYQWVLDSFDQNEIELVNETTEKIINPDGLVGASYTKVFTLKTKKMGKFDIKLSNVRSWEKNEEPAGRFSITINNLPKGL